ncbi:hypothetical protein GVN18_41405 [Pseudomonas sp. ODNR1LW]|nr:hypothetical protein [Pseudomonas sp. ODNR1LW]
MLALFTALALATSVEPAPEPFSVASADGYVLQGVTDRPDAVPIGAVILVAGTGAFDRDMRFGRSGTPRDAVFKDLGQRFAARGLTAVRYDRRGVTFGAPPASAVDALATPGVTAENLSLDAEAVLAWARSPAGLNAKCIVIFAHSEGAVHVAGVADGGRQSAPDLIIGMGAPLESKVSAVKWQSTGRDADSLLMMDEDGDGVVTNDEVRRTWQTTPSGVFGRLEPFLQPDGAWTAEEIASVRTVQTTLYEQSKTAALAQADDAPYPNAQTPAFSYGWWKSWFTDDRPIATRFAAWNAPMSLHYGSLDSQVREDRQRQAASGVLAPERTRFVTHPGRGHTLGPEVLLGPIDEAIADQIAAEAEAACR